MKSVIKRQYTTHVKLMFIDNRTVICFSLPGNAQQQPLTNQIPYLTGSDTHGVTPESCEIRDRQKQVDGELSAVWVKGEAFFMSTPVMPRAVPAVKCPDPSWLYYYGIPISGNEPKMPRNSSVCVVFFGVFLCIH